MITKSIIQYHPDGTEFREWVLAVEDEKVKDFWIFQDGTLAIQGKLGRSIPVKYWLEPPQDYVQDIESLYGKIESQLFSYYPGAVPKWGWLVKAGDKALLIGPFGWYEVQDPMPGGDFEFGYVGSNEKEELR